MPNNIEAQRENRVKIYPNPVVSEFKIETNEPIDVIRIEDTLGNELSCKFDNGLFNVESLSNGIYFLTVFSGDLKWTEKFIVQR